MSARTEYKPGDRVIAGFNGAGTVVSTAFNLDEFTVSNPCYRVVFDRFVDRAASTLSHKSLTPEPATQKPRYTLGELRLIVERAAGVCRCAEYQLRAMKCGACIAKTKYAEFTPAERAMVAPYILFPKLDMYKWAEDYNKTVVTLHVDWANLEFAPDNIVDAFIDKVADRVAAKVTAAQPSKESDKAKISAFVGEMAERIHNYKCKCPNSRCNNHEHEGGFAKVTVGTVALRVCVPCALEINKSLSAQENAKDFGESRYVTATDKQSIKRALAAGKIVNAPRKSGKTTAILELLRENPGKYVAVFVDITAEFAARDYYRILFDCYPHDEATSNATTYERGGKLIAIGDEVRRVHFAASVSTR